jgi:hypothetical protein
MQCFVQKIVHTMFLNNLNTRTMVSRDLKNGTEQETRSAVNNYVEYANVVSYRHIFKKTIGFDFKTFFKYKKLCI